MLIQTRDQFEKALTVLIDADRIVIDTETYYIKRGVPTRLIGIATYCEVKGREPLTISFYLPFRHEHDPSLFSAVDNLPESWLRELAVPFERSDVEFVFHNAKFDMQVLSREGYSLRAPFWDTQLMAHMTNENEYQRSLKVLAEKYVDPDAKDKQQALKKIAKQLGAWEKVPPDVMGLYAEKDVELTWKLFHFLYKELEKQDLVNHWHDEMEYNRTLGIGHPSGKPGLEAMGVRLNLEETKRLAYESKSRSDALQEELGFDPGKPGQLARKLFATQPEGLGLMPLRLTSRKLSPPVLLSNGKRLTRIPVMDEKHLALYNDPTVEKILQWRSEVNANSKWFSPYLEHVWPDGRVHPSFRQDGTATSRLSCADPNMQQLPKVRESSRERVKKMWLASDGMELWEFDYSQVEFRLAVCYSQDQELIDLYNSGVDFHSMTAQKLNIPRDRDGGKVNGKDTNFMGLYGGGNKKWAEVLSVPIDVATFLRSSWWEAYSAIQTVAQEAEKAAATRGYIKYWDGRRRHFTYPSEAYKAFNSLCQGGAARIMMQSMLVFYRKFVEQPIYMVSQVHDALWIEFPEGESDKWVPIIKGVMEWPTKKFPVEFPVDAKRLA